MKAMINEIKETIKNIVKRLLGLETAQKNTVKRLTTLETALDSLNKRLSALEKGAKTTSKKAPKTSAKKEVFYYDITKSDKVNKRNLKSLESSYHYNKERYGKTFKESFKTFNDFKKSLDSLGSIKTRDRVYYTQTEYTKIKENQK